MQQEQEQEEQKTPHIYIFIQSEYSDTKKKWSQKKKSYRLVSVGHL